MNSAEAEQIFCSGDIEGALATGALDQSYTAAALILIGAFARANAIYKDVRLTTTFDRVHLALLCFLQGDVDQAQRLLSELSNCEQRVGVIESHHHLYPPKSEETRWAEIGRLFAEKLAQRSLWAVMHSTRQNLNKFLMKQNEENQRGAGVTGSPVAEVYFDPCEVHTTIDQRFSIAVLNDYEIWQLGNLGNDLGVDLVITPSSSSRESLKGVTNQSIVTNPIFTALSSLHNRGDANIADPYSVYLSHLGERPIDVLFTGSIATAIYRSKAETLFNLTSLPRKINFLAIDRSLPYEYYQIALRSAKFTVNPIRYRGSLNTRAMQGLKQNTFALVEKGSAFMHYGLGQDEGIFEYSNETICKDVKRAIKQWQDLYMALDPFQLNQVLTERIPSSPDLEKIWQRLCAWFALVAPKRNSRNPIRSGSRVQNCWTFDSVERDGDTRLGQKAPIKNGRTFEREIYYTNRFFLHLNDRRFSDCCYSINQGLIEFPSSLILNLLDAFSSYFVRDTPTADKKISNIFFNFERFDHRDNIKLVFGNHRLNTWLMKYALDPIDFLDRQVSLPVMHKTNHCATSPGKLMLDSIVGFREFASCNSRRAFDFKLSIKKEIKSPQQKHLVNLRALEFCLTSDEPVPPGLIESIEQSINYMPWYFQEYLYYADRNEKFDSVLFEGGAHERFLDFVARIVSDRPHASTTYLYPSTKKYLARKCTLTSFEDTTQFLKKSFYFSPRRAYIVASTVFSREDALEEPSSQQQLFSYDPASSFFEN